MSTNHTPNFNLCQWEADDKVLRSDFNADNQKIDAALKANADAIGAAETALAGKADAAALPTARLLDHILETAGSSFSVDVSGIDFTAYREIKIVVTAQCGDDISMWLNNDNGQSYNLSDYTSTGGGQASYRNTYMAQFPAQSGSACGVLTSIVPASGRNVIFINDCIGCDGWEASYARGVSLSKNVQWQNLDTLNFSAPSAVQAGSRVTIFGTR